MTSVYITAAARTPLGAFQGELSALTAPQLGSAAINAVIERSGLAPAHIDEAYMGCVLQAGLGQAPARQAALGAGLSNSVPCTTVHKVCGSGLKSVMLAYDSIMAGQNATLVAGGMESMSNAPYLLAKARSGLRIGHGEVKDHMFLDGLEDAYDRGKLMGQFAEDCAEHYQFTRQAQDEFAIQSTTRAQAAIKAGEFGREIVPIVIKQKSGDVTILHDEQPGKAKLDKIPTLKPAFRDGGTVTAANSSSISDGAAALLIAGEGAVKTHSLRPIARIVAHASHAQEPKWFSTAPIGAMQKCAAKAGWDMGQIDLFEINEAFAVVTMAAIRDLRLDAGRVNIRGGACALGHPIGASGARILVTLIHALQDRGLKRGMASLCIGGGEAVALAIEV
jgi:acetyl-CoA C-acetyltransferase